MRTFRHHSAVARITPMVNRFCLRKCQVRMITFALTLPLILYAYTPTQGSQIGRPSVEEIAQQIKVNAREIMNAKWVVAKPEFQIDLRRRQLRFGPGAIQGTLGFNDTDPGRPAFP